MSTEKLMLAKKENAELIRAKVNAQASMLGLNEYENNKQNIRTNEFGLCNNCKHLQVAKSEFRTLFAQCYEFEIRLNSNEPITECTNYNQRNQLNLSEMKEIAYIIEDKGKDVGFVP